MTRSHSLLLHSLLASAFVGTAAAAAEPGDWPTFNGDLAAQKYTSADQITPQNVGDLEVAWETHTGDVSDGSGDRPPSVWSATPLFVNDTVYLGTPFYRVFALEPDTGAVKWTYDSQSALEALTQPALKNRGVAYWQAAQPVDGEACQKRIYLGTMEGTLHAIDADSGKRCTDFGEDGVLNVNQWNMPDADWPLSLLQPPTVYKDTLFIGWAGKDWVGTKEPPGIVFAVDARSGALKWQFNPLPEDYPGVTGTANVWASMSVDEERGILYLPVSSPSPNFYGGNRKAPIPLATSVTALDTETGAVIWSRQLVHHDIWDFDTDAPPTLVDIRKDGRTIPALVQTTKQAFLYVLDRTTGEPIYPMEERPVPTEGVEGEAPAPTQPFVERPAPAIDIGQWPGVFWLADWASFGYCSQKADELRYDGMFTPPSLEGTITYPATVGGVQWGGGAVDPRTNTFIVNASSVVQIYQLIPREEYQSKARESGNESGFSPQEGAPYGMNLTNFLNGLGMPCWKPPYGTISAYNLDTGDLLWRRPFGQVQKWGFYMPESWGSPTIGGPVVTASGLIFIGASMDSHVRAIDVKSGEALWSAQVDAPAVSLPAVYTYQGRQYVVFAVGGNTILSPRVSDQIVAFALPERRE